MKIAAAVVNCPFNTHIRKCSVPSCCFMEQMIRCSPGKVPVAATDGKLRGKFAEGLVGVSTVPNRWIVDIKFSHNQEHKSE